MRKHFIRQLKYLSFILSALAISLFYQNCSKESVFNSSSVVSSQCLKKMQADSLQKIIGARSLNCANPANYNCESRVFNESVSNDVSSKTICVLADAQELCVLTTIRHYNTASARNAEGVSEDDFQSGGDYNREDVQCSYFDIGSQLPLLRAEGTNIESALNSIYRLCLEAAEPEAL